VRVLLVPPKQRCHRVVGAIPSLDVKGSELGIRNMLSPDPSE
jgi:hypothetical protein